MLAVGRRLAVPYLRGLAEAEAAPLERAVAERTPRELGQLAGARPADIAASTALAGRKMAVVVRADTACRAAPETFDDLQVHCSLRSA